MEPAEERKFYNIFSKNMPPSTTGLGQVPFKDQNVGSNPRGGNTTS